MTGKIKAGLGSFIGNAGEHYVVAELLKRDAVAALAPRNAPAFDILASRADRVVRLRVKTKSEQYDMWQWNAKDDGTVFRQLSKHNDFTVLVNLTQDHHKLRFFVVPTITVNKWLMADFKEWLRAPGK